MFLPFTSEMLNVLFKYYLNLYVKYNNRFRQYLNTQYRECR